MASNSPNRNGSSDIQPYELSAEQTISQRNRELELTFHNFIVFHIELQEQNVTLIQLAERYRDPRNVGVTETELVESEAVVLPDMEKLLSFQVSHQTMIEKLAAAQASMQNNALIESLERRVENIETHQESLQKIRSLYEEAKKLVETVGQQQEAVFGTLQTVMPLVERDLTAINEQRKLNNEQ